MAAKAKCAETAQCVVRASPIFRASRQPAAHSLRHPAALKPKSSQIHGVFTCAWSILDQLRRDAPFMLAAAK
jgi:hypothetical protein